MKIIREIEGKAPEIWRIINKFGWSPQHNYCLFKNYGRKGELPVFFVGEHGGLFAYQKKDVWRILTDSIAPAAQDLKFFLSVIDWIFQNKPTQKIILEDISEDFRREILAAAKTKNWRATKPSYSLFWPRIDLKNWDQNLAGGQWKRLRNIYNKFFKENKVEFSSPAEVGKKELLKIAVKWKKQRHDNDRVHFEQYLRFIENNFEGCDLIRIMIISGRPSAINGGWRIPNSQNYYSYLGLYDYDFKGIGEVSYIDEFNQAKKMGFEKIDLGGSYGGLLDFKMKFHPTEIYRTDTFSILKR